MDIYTKNKIKNIQNYIIDLYGLTLKNGEYNAEASRMFGDTSFENWCEALDRFSEVEIKDAINKFFKNHNNRTAPRLAQLQRMLRPDFNEKKDSSVDLLPKPLCPIADWEEDWDYVCRWACVYGIVYIPYWSKAQDVKSEHEIATRKAFASRKYKQVWDDVVSKLKEERQDEFAELMNYNWLVHYVWAYRVGALQIPTDINGGENV